MSNKIHKIKKEDEVGLMSPKDVEETLKAMRG